MLRTTESWGRARSVNPVRGRWRGAPRAGPGHGRFGPSERSPWFARPVVRHRSERDRELFRRRVRHEVVLVPGPVIHGVFAVGEERHQLTGDRDYGADRLLVARGGGH